MPTLIRLFVLIAIIAVLGYGAMFALANFVEPTPKETTIRIPARMLNQP